MEQKPTEAAVSRALATLMRDGWNPLPPANQKALIEQRDALWDALERIANMPKEPRPDGTFNYSREALIQIARLALGNE